MSDIIGHPWKPGASRSAPHASRAPLAQAKPPKRKRTGGRGIGGLKRWGPVVVVLVLVGGLAMSVLAWRQMEQRRAIVEAERERFAAYVQGREAAFQQVPAMTAREQQLLRRSRNARHLELAQQLGISRIASRDQVEARVAAENLVRLGDSRYYWLARMSHSVPYVTQDAAAALDLIGERFQARLAERGLPPIQYNITSVLRTQADQNRLRGVNINAAVGPSSHEFGTTVDLHYQRVRYRADARAEVAAALGPLPYGFLYDEFAGELSAAYDRLAQQYVSRIGAELGRVLIDLENSGYTVAIREVRQPVFHVTVARRMAR